MPMAPDHPILRGERVWLRPLEKEDALNGSLEDAELAHYAGFTRSFSRMETEQWLQHMAGGDERHRSEVRFAICLLGSTEAIGNCGLRGIDRLHGSGELSILISDRNQWSQGLGTDAVRVLVDFGFGEMRLERIWLRTFDYNPRAIRSYEKAGFAREVLMRRARFHHGAHHDVLLMAIIRADWLAQDRPRSWDY